MNWLLNFFRSLFSKKKPAPVPTPSPSPSPVPVVKVPSFVDNFTTLDTTKWFVTPGWQSPFTSPTNKGSFPANNVSIVNGMLCLKLTQTRNTDGTFTSLGGEINSVQKFGYGTYEFVAKASSNSADPSQAGSSVSGSITGGFSYLDKSITEIDVEVEGIPTRANLAQFTSWILETSPSEEVQVPLSVAPSATFHKYKYVWTPTAITFFVDDIQVAKNTKVIPSQPAQFLFNHYGTNDASWGGTATPGVDRFVFIKNFTFTPQ